MCRSPNTSVLQRTIDLKYANKQRTASLRWLLVNGALLAVLLLDLWRWSGPWRCCGAWAELVVAGALAASCARHALRLAPERARAAPAALSPRQRALLGLSHDDLDGSFVMSPSPRPARASEAAEAAEELSTPGSLSPARRWRGPDSPPSPPSPPTPVRRRLADHAEPPEFISDATALKAYIRQQEARAAGAGAAGPPPSSPPPRSHQLSVMPDRAAKDGAAEDEGGAGLGAGAGGAPLWRRLQLDPQRLTQYNLNLRLWLHASVVSRVARELAAAGPEALSPEHALAPFLRPFADRQYVAERVGELARGGCLSAYRWNGGGRGWRAGGAARPADAELLLHLLAAYLDLLVPGGDFSARHLAPAAPGAPPPRAPALCRARADPPHYVLLLPDETVELPSGRNNLLHTLLLFVAVLARESPPALCRLHLGPAGLNMLWILGR